MKVRTHHLPGKVRRMRDIRIGGFRVENLTGNLLNRTTRPGRLFVTECLCVFVCVCVCVCLCVCVNVKFVGKDQD